MVELDTTSITVGEHVGPSKCRNSFCYKVIIRLAARGTESYIGAHGASELIGRTVPVRISPIIVDIAVIVQLQGHGSPCQVAGVIRA